MKYMGSKSRHAKEILPLILTDRKPGQLYIEPFVGGANVIDKVDGPRIGNDSHYQLIEMWKALQSGWEPPKEVSEEEYKKIHILGEDYTHPAHISYVGFNLSYGGKYWGGYRRDSVGIRNYAAEAYRGIMKQVPLIRDVIFTNYDYRVLPIPDGSLVYADPPYRGTTPYKGGFNSDMFWDWVRAIATKATIFVSEYTAPEDFRCVWEKEVTSSLTRDTGSKTGIERLFVYDN